MTPEQIQRLQSDTQGAGIDIAGMFNQQPNTPPVTPQNVELPQNPSIDLVSYIQSIQDGIVAASEGDVLKMIMEIASIKSQSPELEQNGLDINGL